MQCTKIRLTKKGAEIVYLNEAKGGKRVTTYTSKEAPLPDLTNAVKAFVPWVIDLCERAAERYVNGEHGEQLTFDDAGEDDEDEGEETVEEEKPRRKRGRQLEAVEA